MIASACPATDWAWDQVSARHLNFDPGTTPIALVLLAFAREADEALSSPNGYDVTTLTQVVDRLRLDASAVLNAADHLRAAGLLVWARRGYRIPEEAFQAYVPMRLR